MYIVHIQDSERREKRVKRTKKCEKEDFFMTKKEEIFLLREKEEAQSMYRIKRGEITK